MSCPAAGGILVEVNKVSDYFNIKMSAVGAFTVTKENIEDDRALLTKGVIGTGTEVNMMKDADNEISL